MKDIEGMIDEKAMDRTEVHHSFHDTSGEKQSEYPESYPVKTASPEVQAWISAEVNRLVKQFEQSKKMMKQMPGLTGGKMNMGKRGGFKLPF